MLLLGLLLLLVGGALFAVSELRVAAANPAARIPVLRRPPVRPRSQFWPAATGMGCSIVGALQLSHGMAWGAAVVALVPLLAGLPIVLRHNRRVVGTGIR